ncbi:hypothetical protein O3Q52_01565, partial [Streptomyces sp. ActVer]|nr:hypothetical protein [Streptomyces sp. ActVer]
MGARSASVAGWVGLPPIQRAAVGRTGVADSGFGGRLSTWQNPSFTGPLSHAVLDGAPGGLVRNALTTSARPVSGLEPPSHTLLPVRSDEPEAPGDVRDDAAPIPVPVQRAPRPVTASRPAGPRVTPVPPRSHRPSPLTRAPATPAVQRRALPVARREAGGGVVGKI